MPKIKPANWRFGGHKIYVTDDSHDKKKHRWAKHAILDSMQTTLHWTGTDDLVREIEFYDFDNRWESTFMPMMQDETLYWLRSDKGLQHKYWVEEAEAEKLYDYYQGTPSVVWKIKMRLRRSAN